MDEKPTKSASDHSALLRQALRAVEQMKQRVEAAENRLRQPIAIVGLGCRFPGGVSDPESFWELLREGRDAISEVPADRWNIDEYYDPNPASLGTMISRYGGFLNSADYSIGQFDAEFFGIAPREAAMMDPQQRILLEVAWAALETAGIAPSSLAASRTGVYLGMASGDYGLRQMEAGDAGLLDVHYASGNAHSIASGRLSYLLGLRGPSLTLDTACSSSLLAVHLACQALRSGDCTLALAGGVNVILSPETTVALSQAHMLAPDGRCKSFDASADGYVRSEGCGLVVLKTLAQARADGDRVFAVIRGSAANQDGASSSLTAPNGPVQEELMRRALEDAGATAAEFGFVEAHGTGTALGDPIELRALRAVYGVARGEGDPLPLGSLKTNVGHMEAAAGVGGLIKLVLALMHGAIPANLHFKRPTPHVPWEKLRLTVPTAMREWTTRDGKARLGAVSSFGFSGTNVHLIVEQGPVVLGQDAADSDTELPRLLAVSAKNLAALRDLVARYAEFLKSDSEWSLAEIAAAAGLGRDHFRYRAAVVARSKGEAADRLEAEMAAAGFAKAAAAEPLTFLFTGQGSERAGMGLELLQRSGVFRAAVERLETALGGVLGASIEAIWASRNGELERASLVQPALYVFGWALSELWRSWGVTPETVLGHSLGEYVAATVAGVMTPEDGVRLVAARGRLTEELGLPGGMVAVVASVDIVRGLLGDLEGLSGDLSIAAVNGPSSVVVSGVLRTLDLLEERLRQNGMRHKRLRTTHGFHSAALDGMLDAFEAEAARIAFRVPEIGWVSNLTGELVGREKPVDARYWRRHLRETVRFEDGLRAADGVLLEVGAEPQLLALAEANGIDGERRVASIARSGGGDWEKLLGAAGRLYCLGVGLDWRGMAEGQAHRRAALPGYPFERRRFWFTDGGRGKKADAQAGFDREASGHPLLGARLRLRGEQTVFHGVVSAQSPAHLGDHVLMGKRIVPGAAYLDMALAAARAVDGGGEWSAAEVEFREPCVFDEPRLLETVLLPSDGTDGRRRFEISSAAVDGGEWTLHVTGFLDAAVAVGDEETVDLAAWRERAASEWEGVALYERLGGAGLGFGPAFRPVARAWGSAQESLVELAFLPEVLDEAGWYGVHPAVLDGCLQASAALMEAEAPTAPALPASVAAYRVLGDVARLKYATATVQRRLGRMVTVDIRGLDGEGRCLLVAEGLMLVEVRAEAADWRGWLQEVVWEKALLGGGIADGSGNGSVRRVLIVSGDEAGSLASSLAALARADGAAVEVVSASLAAADGLRDWTVRGGKAEIFYLPGAELAAVGAEATTEDALGWQERVLSGALGWTQALIAAERIGQVRLWLVGCGTAGAAASSLDSSPDAASLPAFARSARAEYPEAEAVAVDLETDGEDAARQLWRLGLDFGQQDSRIEPQYVLRGGSAWVPRLVPRALAGDAEGQTLRLRFPETGLMEDLKPGSEPRRAPVGSEIEVAIRATAINFHEVLSALNPGHAEGMAPGGECSGVVVRVGPDVAEDDLRVGDEVVVVAAGLMAEFATATRERVWKKPAGLSMEEAATVPIAFLTARWCLERVAHVQAGEWVLVHAGAGGVGMASIQEALRLGARVLATAGSDAKRALVLELGAEVVFDSRSATFEQGVMAATGGRGVDVVLNSLAGDKIGAGLRVLAPGGRFIELGELTVLSDKERAGLRPDIRYEVVQLRNELAVPTPESLETIASVLADFEAGTLRPLPWTRFALSDAAEAFRMMAAGLHTGRVLLSPDRDLETAGGKTAIAKFSGFRGDGAYVVSGAFGGLGLAVVEWLAQQGAGCVLALGRSAPSAETEARLERLRAGGTEVVALRCDVSDEDGLAKALAAVPERFALRGVFHCAGVWANGALPNQTVELYREALAAKVGGGWNLHRLTQDAELDCFVLFSSVAGPMGSRGQSNYAAANAYLDGLAHYRRERLGLTALSVDWGAWSEVGAAVRHGMVERSERGGVVSITPAKGLAILRRLLEEDTAQVMVSKVDWKKWAVSFPAEYAANVELLSGLMPAGSGNVGVGKAGSGWMAEWLETPMAQRRQKLAVRVEERLRAALSLGSRQAIDRARPLQEYGLDSLLAIELRNALSADLETKLSSTALFDYPTMGGLTDWLFDDVLKAEGSADLADEAVLHAADAITRDVVSGVSELSDEEVERLFQEKMART